jgi:branched-chain amino acid transport system permease protein
MEFTFFVTQFFNGLSNAMLIFLIASGLTLIFGVLDVLNFAHGSMYALGAYICYSSTIYFGKSGGFWISLILAPVAVSIVGGIIEYFFIRPVYKLELYLQLLVTYGFILILDDVIRMVWGANIVSTPSLGIFSKSFTFCGIFFPLYFLFVIIVGFLVAIVLYLFLTRTKFGKIVRAASSDKEMVEALGINVRKLYTTVFCIGSLLAGLGGALDGPIRGLTPALGADVIIPAFAVVIIGGLGSYGGAIFASFLIGEIITFGVIFVPKLAMVLIYIFMAITLLLRPAGLLRKL